MRTNSFGQKLLFNHFVFIFWCILGTKTRINLNLISYCIACLSLSIFQHTSIASFLMKKSRENFKTFFLRNKNARVFFKHIDIGRWIQRKELSPRSAERVRRRQRKNISCKKLSMTRLRSRQLCNFCIFL